MWRFSSTKVDFFCTLWRVFSVFNRMKEPILPRSEALEVSFDLFVF